MTENLVAILNKYKYQEGPIIFFCCDVAGLSWLYEKFCALAIRQEGFSISRDSPISSDDLFVIEVRSSLGEGSKIDRVAPAFFQWSVSQTNAKSIAEKLQSLLQSNIPGHHYFDFMHGNYRSVVVSKFEEPQSLVRKMRDASI